MRLHELQLQAIGPFATAQVIDFDRLSASGLFLLEGPTGAGKSTILDAIAFALYGSLAADTSGRDRLHSDFAPPDVEPKATLQLSVGGVRWRVSRVPEHERLKRRGGGTTKELSSVHLERNDSGGWTSVSSNKAEVGDIITKLLGLSREQFTQVVLLPQGEFARFLRADDDDRRQLLTKLFGTRLYDRVTAELERGRSEASRVREMAKLKIEHALAAAGEAAELDAELRAELLAATSEQRVERISQVEAELAAAATSTALVVTEITTKLVAAQTLHDSAKKQSELMSRRVDLLARLTEHASTRREHDLREARLTAARKAEPVRPLLDALDEAELNVVERRAALSALVATPTDDMCAGRGAEVLSMQAAIADRRAAELQHLVDLESGRPAKDAEIVEQKRAAEQAAARLAELATSKQTLPGVIAEVQRQLDDARVRAGQLENLEARSRVAQDQLAAAKRLIELEPLVTSKQAAVAAAVSAHQERVDVHQQMVEARLAGMAAELASELAEGAPCPVCGSTDHPAKAQPSEGAVSPATLERARQLRDEAAAARDSIERELQPLLLEKATASTVASGRGLEEISSEAGGLAEETSAARATAQQVAALELKLVEQRAEQDRITGDELRAATLAATAKEQAQRSEAELAELNEQLSQAAEGHASVSERQRVLREEAARSGKLGQAISALGGALSHAATARSRAEREASTGAFSDLQQARASALDGSAMAQIEEEVRRWGETLASLEAAVGSDDLAGLDPTAADCVHEAARAAAEAFELANAELETWRTAAKKAATRAERFAARVSEVREAEAAHTALVHKTEPVVQLAALAKGTEGHRRVNLTTYVLRQWFEQVVAAANLRLSTVSSGRYALRRIDEGLSKRDRVGLTLTVTDRHTGEERSPSSLSGGETFYTSLALALGLVDVVKAEAGGVDLGTLFIDEGFGSLDGETLDQVMVVIDELRDCGRVVGIVSHVNELKERIQERLEVRRLEDGSSTVNLVA